MAAVPAKPGDAAKRWPTSCTQKLKETFKDAPDDWEDVDARFADGDKAVHLEENSRRRASNHFEWPASKETEVQKSAGHLRTVDSRRGGLHRHRGMARAASIEGPAARRP